MGAPAMQRLELSEMVRRKARFAQTCEPEDFPRLAAAAQVIEAVQFDCRFGRADDGTPLLEGEARASLQLECQRCEEAVQRQLEMRFELCLVDEARAARVAPEREIRIVEDGSVNLPEIVEDELLLHLPLKVCQASDCPNMPPLTFGPAVEAEAERQENPFAVLANLKTTK